MTQNQVEHIGEKLIIKGRRTPFIIRAVLTIILTICVLIPIIATFFVISSGNGLHIGIVISYALFWGSGFYTLRILLWNSYGREILILDKDKIGYIADYKLFRDGRKEIGTEEITAEIIYEDEPNKPFGRLRLKNKTNNIETVLKSTLVELEQIEKKINTRYNN